jgi:uncharacterized Ntn-hydrolase superfamily protein
VAVASKFLAAGAVVPWARAGAGALATQAYANLDYGPEGLDRLSRGEDASSVVAVLTDADDGRAERQLGMVDSLGKAATYTGEACLDWAGGVIGEGFCCQGNILTGPDVVESMTESFQATEGDLARRLVAALRAGDVAGGDRRGRQSAALLVVRDGGGYLGSSDVAVDLRVDDHFDPAAEIDRLVGVHRVLFPRPEELDWIEVDERLAAELRQRLDAAGRDPGSGTGYDDRLRSALSEWMGMENLELRWSDEARIDRTALEMLRRSTQ